MDRNIKTAIIIIVYYVFNKLEERVNMLTGDREYRERLRLTETLRDEDYDVQDEVFMRQN